MYVCLRWSAIGIRHILDVLYSAHIGCIDVHIAHVRAVSAQKGATDEAEKQPFLCVGTEGSDACRANKNTHDNDVAGNDTCEIVTKRRDISGHNKTNSYT